MNKDTVVASVIGFGLGLIAAIALWVVPKFIPKSATSPAPSDISAVEESSMPVATTGTTAFEVTSPHDGDIEKTAQVKLTGRASNANLVVVSTPGDSQVVTPAKNGDFTATINLSDGSNEVVVTSFVKGTTDTKDLFVYYFAEGI